LKNSLTIKTKGEYIIKSLGTTRTIDNLGRVVLPAELRKTLGLKEKDTMEIYTEGEFIMLKKFEAGCTFCGEVRDIINYKGKNICKKCRKELKL